MGDLKVCYTPPLYSHTRPTLTPTPRVRSRSSCTTWSFNTSNPHFPWRWVSRSPPSPPRPHRPRPLGSQLSSCRLPTDRPVCVRRQARASRASTTPRSRPRESRTAPLSCRTPSPTSRLRSRPTTCRSVRPNTELTVAEPAVDTAAPSSVCTAYEFAKKARLLSSTSSVDLELGLLLTRILPYVHSFPATLQRASSTPSNPLPALTLG